MSQATDEFSTASECAHPLSHVRRHWAVFLGLAVGLIVWGVVDVARRARIDPARPSLHMTDFTVYTEAGAAFFDGREPYEVTNIRGWKYLYPPLFALLVSPLAPLPAPWQAAVWFGISALMAFGCYFECRRLLGFCRGPRWSEGIPRWLLVAAFVTPLFPAFNCLQRGQMGIALVYPLLLGSRLVWTGRKNWQQALGGLILALPIALKLTPLLPVACLIAMSGIQAGLVAGATVDAWRNRLRAVASSMNLVSSNGDEGISPGTSRQFVNATAGVVAGCALFLLLLPAVLLGWDNNLRHLHTWYVKVASRVDDVRSDDFGGDVASLRNQSLHNAVFRSGNWVAHQFFGGPDDIRMNVRMGAMPMDAPIVGRLLTAARFAALAVLGLVLLVAGFARQQTLTTAAFGIACVATLVVSPVSRGHYFVFWLPAILFVPLWFLQQGRKQMALFAAIIPAALTLLHYALLPYAGRIGLLGLGTSAWYFTVCWTVWRSRRLATGQSAVVDRLHPTTNFARDAA